MKILFATMLQRVNFASAIVLCHLINENKMKRFFSTSLFFLVVAAIFTSCKDDAPEVVDVTIPTISNVQFNETVEPGGVLELTFKLIDDIGLGEVRIDIHDDFDGHQHENGRIKATPFAYSNVLDEMRGVKVYTVEESINIPEEASTGPYHLQIRYFDAAGNEGVVYVATFEISSETKSPAILITNFAVGEELEPTLNEDGTKVLYLEGTIESRTAGGLDEVHITVVHEEEGGHSHLRKLHDAPVYDQEWELAGAATFNLGDISPVIDLSNAEAGHYELRIFARDVEGNIKIVSREVHVE